LVRWLGSTTFLLTIILYLGVALYAPCVSLSLVTGVPVWVYIVSGGLLSILITAFGGLRTVVWADAWQAGIMVSGLVGMIVLGVQGLQGGMKEVWQTSFSRGRVELADWSMDPTHRASSLPIFFGQFIQWATIYTCHQTQVQRYCSLKSVSTARWSLAVNTLVVWIINVGAILVGLVVFTTYADCDPLATDHIKKTDQLATYFVLNVVTRVPGLPGLFLAALVSGALSSLSSGLNSLASVLWEDFLAHTQWANSTSERKKVGVTRMLAGGFGVISTGLALGFSHLDGVLKVATTSIGMLSGPLLSVFLLGYFVNFNNKVGAVAGMLTGHCVTLWIAAGALFITKGVRRPALETSTEGCPALQFHQQNNASYLVDESVEIEYSGVEYLYNISPFLFPVVGFVVASVVSILTSLVSLPCWSPRPPPSHLLHPLARREKRVPPPAPPLADTGRWEDQDSHYRWPSPSLPPTLKKPRPGDTYRLGGRSRSGFINGYENNSYDDWSDVGTAKRSTGWSTLNSQKSSINGFYNSRL